MQHSRRWFSTLLIGAGSASMLLPGFAEAANQVEIDQKVDAALKQLLAKNTGARELYKTAHAVLMFPRIVKGGFLVGGAYGEGALRKDGRTSGYYQSVAASYGFQAGIQTFGYALFFMNDAALAYLNKSDGWEVGVGPSIVVADEGFARKISSTTLSQDVYAFIFSQKGLMAGAGIEGAKISKIG
jgi:lipid-binding SYLF domain-containing protein